MKNDKVMRCRRGFYRLLSLSFFIYHLLFSVALVSCGPEDGRFRLEGQLQNVDQSEFYIYSLDAGATKLDTIKVSQGHFVYETDLQKLATFVLLYPNFSEQVVFGNSGVIAKLDGDALHLKEVKVTGTEENDKMTEWRLSVSELTPPKVKERAVEFIRENPGSIISNYLLRRYLILDGDEDYRTADDLAEVMLKAQPDNGRLRNLEKQLRGMRYTVKGAIIPNFRATDIKGNPVGRQSLKGEVNVISIWAKWSFESQSIQRKLHALQRKYGSRLGLVSISLDGNIQDCKDFVERDSIRWSIICDGRMWDTPLVTELGFMDMPGNLLLDQKGKVLDINVPNNEIEERIKAILK